MESGPASAGYVAERLDHLGIVAGPACVAKSVCREIELAEWVDEQDTPNRSFIRGPVPALPVSPDKGLHPCHQNPHRRIGRLSSCPFLA